MSNDRYLSDTTDVEYEIDTYDEWQGVFTGTTCGGKSLSSAAISTTTDDERDDKRLTIIYDDETHEPDAFTIVDEYTNKLRISIYDRDVPTSLNGTSPQTLHGAEVVVTYDGDTYSGYVSGTNREYNKSLFTISVDP